MQLNRIFLSITRLLPAFFRPLPVILSLLLVLGGCGLQQEARLDADDLRFAAFYSDYLSRSGVTPNGNAAPYTDLTLAELDTLFARHGLDQKTFDAKLRAYSQNPELWRAVLERVRKDLRNRE